MLWTAGISTVKTVIIELCAMQLRIPYLGIGAKNITAPLF